MSAYFWHFPPPCISFRKKTQTGPRNLLSTIFGTNSQYHKTRVIRVQIASENKCILVGVHLCISFCIYSWQMAICHHKRNQFFVYSSNSTIVFAFYFSRSPIAFPSCRNSFPLARPLLMAPPPHRPPMAEVVQCLEAMAHDFLNPSPPPWYILCPFLQWNPFTRVVIPSRLCLRRMTFWRAFLDLFIFIFLRSNILLPLPMKGTFLRILDPPYLPWLILLFFEMMHIEKYFLEFPRGRFSALSDCYLRFITCPKRPREFFLQAPYVILIVHCLFLYKD